jgi:hypothetical protein
VGKSSVSLRQTKDRPKDFEEFCARTGNELLSSAMQNGEFMFLIRRH